MTEKSELTAEELEAEAAGKLPDRQAMTTLGDLGTSGLLPDSLLDLDVNLDLDADVAAPIDAAVSANVLSPGSASIATATQDSTIVQELDGVAEANANQDATIDQGDTESTTGA